MGRFFNTAGPVRPDKHYCIPPLERIRLPVVLTLIEQEKYFVLHAPRQTGKTSCLLALRDHLNLAAHYRCVYVNVEGGQAARENVAEGIRAILSRLADETAKQTGDATVQRIWRDILQESGPFDALAHTLGAWSRASDRPIVLLLDEIDSLVGDTLISVLRQLRSGYPDRPAGFPQSIVLCGVRDVRDYRLHVDDSKEVVTGGSAFNIKAKSLRLGNFSPEEVRKLLAQHTAETGQVFEEAAIDLIWDYSAGQPWVVNALAYETCFEMPEGRDRTCPITAGMVAEAKEALILRRETHLDQLADKLREPRVRRVVELLLSGDAPPDLPLDDVEYVHDLGLVTVQPELRIANRLYQEVVPRQRTYTTQIAIHQPTQWYVRPDGSLDIPKLLEAFQEFFRDIADAWLERFDYKEAGPHLLLQAFLQRVINGGGHIAREYGLGRKRTDLLVTWPHAGGRQRVVIELKLLHKGLEQTIAQGRGQTAEYMDTCGAPEGHLLVFDRTPGRSWDEKVFRRAGSQPRSGLARPCPWPHTADHPKMSCVRLPIRGRTHGSRCSTARRCTGRRPRRSPCRRAS